MYVAKNKGADQLFGNHAADPHLCFRICERHAGFLIMGIIQYIQYAIHLQTDRIYKMSRIIRKHVSRFPTRSDTNWAVKP